MTTTMIIIIMISYLFGNRLQIDCYQVHVLGRDFKQSLFYDLWKFALNIWWINAPQQ